MSGKDLGPLDWRIAITDKNGRPTPEFQRRWATQRDNNDLIGATLGSGVPPVTPAPADGQEYVDISVTPHILYVGNNGVWEKVGVYAFTDLNDVPHSYSGTGDELVKVNSGATGLEFKTLSGVLDTLGSATGDVLYRASTGWVTLAPGTTGQVLTTQGASANPIWSSVTTNLDTIGNVQGDLLYRNATVWTVLPPGTSGRVLTTNGASANPSWNTVTSSLDTIGAVQGDLLYRNATTWTVLAPGTSGTVLQSAGAAANPAWTTNISLPSGTVNIPSTFSYQIGGSNILSARNSTPFNTFVGGSAGVNNTGNDNTAVGFVALGSGGVGTTGTQNVAIGNYALNHNTSGGNNMAVGYQSLYQNTTGSNNVGFGPLALQLNTTGSQNMAVGFEALQNNTTGAGNVAVGRIALNTNSVGLSNTAIGNIAGQFVTGSSNIAIGAGALINNPHTGSSNIYIGNNLSSPSSSSSNTLNIGAAILGQAIASNIASGQTIGINGNLVVGNINSLSALATTAVNGFMYLPSMAGTPTGVPTSFSPMCPLIYDTTGQKLWVYDAVGTTWRSFSNATGANPTGTASDTAVNGTATTFMRSDAAPAVQKSSSSQFGIVKVDGTTITSTGGVISSSGGGGGASAHPGFTTGLWYSPFGAGGQTVTFTTNLNTLYAAPFYVPTSTVFTKVGFSIATAATGNYQIGVYTNVNGTPTTRVYDSGSHAAANGSNTLTGQTITLSAGWYWVVIGFSATNSFMDGYALPAINYLLGSTSINTGSSCITGAFTFGTMPTTFPTVAYSGTATAPCVQLQL